MGIAFYLMDKENVTMLCFVMLFSSWHNHARLERHIFKGNDGFA